MADGLINDNFDRFLEKVDQGFTLSERKKVNRSEEHTSELQSPR